MRPHHIYFCSSVMNELRINKFSNEYNVCLDGKYAIIDNNRYVVNSSDYITVCLLDFYPDKLEKSAKLAYEKYMFYEQLLSD